MSESTQALPPAAPRRSRGVVSLWLWIGAVAATVAYVAVFKDTPKGASIAWHLSAPVLLIVLTFVWLAALLAGLVTGIQGIVRPGDRRGLAIAGTALHAVTIIAGLWLTWSGVGIMGLFR